VIYTLMRIPHVSILICGFAVAGCTTAPMGDAPPMNNSATGEGAQRVVLNNLLTEELEGVEGTEVVVSHVRIPPNTSLPKHWHPGEEFAYILEGSVTLWQEGKVDIAGKKGDVMKVPLKQVHTAITKEEGVTLLVFRVHEKGQPERVRAE